MCVSAAAITICQAAVAASCSRTEGRAGVCTNRLPYSFLPCIPASCTCNVGRMGGCHERSCHAALSGSGGHCMHCLAQPLRIAQACIYTAPASTATATACPLNQRQLQVYAFMRGAGLDATHTLFVDQHQSVRSHSRLSNVRRFFVWVTRGGGLPLAGVRLTPSSPTLTPALPTSPSSPPSPASPAHAPFHPHTSEC